MASPLGTSVGNMEFLVVQAGLMNRTVLSTSNTLIFFINLLTTFFYEPISSTIAGQNLQVESKTKNKSL